MPKLSHFSLTLISSLIWFTIGLFLLTLGNRLLLEATNVPLEEATNLPLIRALGGISGEMNTILIVLLAIGAVVGYLKGRFVLGKTARKQVARILTFPNPTSISNLYGPRYFLLIAFMFCLGFLIKYLGIPKDIRGTIDVAIGIALITGAQAYLRHGLILINRSSS